MGEVQANFIIDTSEIESIIGDIRETTIHKEIADWLFNYVSIIDNFWDFIDIKALSGKDKLIIKIIPKEELGKIHNELRRRYARITRMDT